MTPAPQETWQWGRGTGRRGESSSHIQLNHSLLSSPYPLGLRSPSTGVYDELKAGEVTAEDKAGKWQSLFFSKGKERNPSRRWEKLRGQVSDDVVVPLIDQKDRHKH